MRANALGAVAVVAAAALLLGGCGGEDTSATAGGSATSSPAETPPETPAETPPETPAETASAAGEPLMLSMAAAGGARCMMPSPRTLQGFGTAFGGTVTEVEGDQVVLDVDRWFRGGPHEQVVVTTSDDETTLYGLFELREGARYLISGDNGQVSLCGNSGRWSPRLERLFEQAFAG